MSIPDFAIQTAGFAQVLGVLTATRTLDLSVGHLPTESNLAADALSRQEGPLEERKPWPFPQEQGVGLARVLRPRKLWDLLS